MTFYHDRPEDWRDGVEQEVSDIRAEHLLADFPDNFSVIAVTKAETAPKNKAESPPGNKGVFRRGRGRPPKSRK